MEKSDGKMLIVKNLTKTYSLEKQKHYANKDINFSVEKGKMVWIYGNSGSGKNNIAEYDFRSGYSRPGNC